MNGRRGKRGSGRGEITEVEVAAIERQLAKDYRAKDHPLKCRVCGEWMRFQPASGLRQYKRRAPVPNAGSCTDCLERYKCDVCPRTDPHIHCPECGDTTHRADQCDMEG